MAKKGKKKPQKVADVKGCAPDTKFRVGQLVGAQVKGHPMWPGIVEDVRVKGSKTDYVVRFFGTNQTAVKFHMLKLYEDMTEQEKKRKAKGLQDALQECQLEYETRKRDETKRRAASPSPSIMSAVSDVQSAQSEAQSVQSGPVAAQEHHLSPEPPASSVPSAPSENGSMPSATSVPSPITNSSIKVEINTHERMDCEETILPPTKIKLEKGGSPRKSIQRSPIKLDTRTDNNHANSLKPDKGDISSITNTIIAKLEQKVRSKLEEKELKKEEKKREKVSRKVFNLNSSLSKSLEVAQKLRSISSDSQFDTKECKIAVQRIKLILDAVKVCIDKFLRKKRLDDLRESRDILTDLAKSLKAAKKNDKLPQSIREQLKVCSNLTRKEKIIRDFIEIHDDEFGRRENAMIERKENSVNQ